MKVDMHKIDWNVHKQILNLLNKIWQDQKHITETPYLRKVYVTWDKLAKVKVVAGKPTNEHACQQFIPLCEN